MSGMSDASTGAEEGEVGKGMRSQGFDDFDGFSDNILGDKVKKGVSDAGTGLSRALWAMGRRKEEKAHSSVRFYLVLAIAGGILFFLMLSFISSNNVAYFLGKQIYSLADKLGISEQELVSDPKLLADALRECEDEEFIYDGFMQVLDKDTAVQLLDAIVMENEKHITKTITYIGETVEAPTLPFINEISGEIDKSYPEFSFEYTSETVDEEQVLESEGISQAIKELEYKASNPPEDILSCDIPNYMYGIEQEMAGQTKALEEVLEKEEKAAIEKARAEEEAYQLAYEKAYAEYEWKKPVFGTVESTVQVSLGDVESYSSDELQNPYLVQWQPVLAFAAVIIQNCYKDWGTHGNEDGSTYTLSSAQIKDIMDLFSFDFYTYDTYLDDTVSKLDVDYALTHTAGYRLSIDKSTLQNSKQCAVVKRVPALAPMLIENGYIKYSYKYRQLADCYYVLDGREVLYYPSKFLEFAYELDPAFDVKRFLHYLESLPGTERMVAEYTKLFSMDDGQEDYTTDSSVCPSIGTYLHVEGGNLEEGTAYIKNLLSPQQISGYLSQIDVSGGREKAVAFAFSRVGYPYSQEKRASGEAYDCSSLCFYAWMEGGVNLSGNGTYPPTAAAIAKRLVEMGMTIKDTEDLCPGDLIFWGGTNNGRYLGIDHVAMYVGDNHTVEAYGKKTGVVLKSMKGRRAWVLMCHVE